MAPFRRSTTIGLLKIEIADEPKSITRPSKKRAGIGEFDHHSLPFGKVFVVI